MYQRIIKRLWVITSGKPIYFADPPLLAVFSLESALLLRSPADHGRWPTFALLMLQIRCFFSQTGRVSSHSDRLRFDVDFPYPSCDISRADRVTRQALTMANRLLGLSGRRRCRRRAEPNPSPRASGVAFAFPWQIDGYSERVITAPLVERTTSATVRGVRSSQTSLRGFLMTAGRLMYTPQPLNCFVTYPFFFWRITSCDRAVFLFRQSCSDSCRVLIRPLELHVPRYPYMQAPFHYPA
jgi:hypothetical protein